MRRRLLLALCVVLTCGLAWAKDMPGLDLLPAGSKGEAKEGNKGENRSLTVTGDTVQYSPESRQFTATGNVRVEYKGAVLTCDSISVDTSTKKAVAEGHARLDEPKGTLEGDKITYDFDRRSGLIENARFRANPYFGSTELLEKISDTHFIARRSRVSTCSYDHPHYYFFGRKIDVYPNEKLVLKDSLFYIKDVPLMYLPEYTRRFQDPLVHVQVTPGSSKDWGKYVLSAWQYQLSDQVSGKIFFDVRSRLGLAGGFGANVKTSNYGTGDLRFYDSHESPRDQKDKAKSTFDRYMLRARHKWEIDENTSFVAELNKIGDQKRKYLDQSVNVLKDYFPREYEKDTNPLTYAALHRSYRYSSLDFLVQKRVNNWNTETEKLPEVTFNMPSIQLGASKLYLENISSFASLNQANGSPVAPNTDKGVNKLETSNKFSVPSRVGIFNFTPFVANKFSVFDRDINGSDMWGSPRTIFSTGADVSTKFYRLYNLRTNALGLDINGLRHIFTPTVSYTYQHKPTVPSSKLLLETIPGPANTAAIGIQNKLQTKKNGKKVDIADIRVTTPYNLKTGDGNKSGSAIGDILYEMDLIPYSWATVHGDLTYALAGSHDRETNPNYGHVSQVDYDINFNLPRNRTLGIGQRYQRNGENEITTSLSYWLNPKWKVLLLQRYLISSNLTTKRGLHEQQYTLVRDLHCWTSELTFSVDRDQGASMYLVFRLKAFPELQIDYNKSYSSPKPGSQNTP